MPNPHAVVYINLWLFFGIEEARQSVKESGHHKRSEVLWWAERELVLLDDGEELAGGGEGRDGCEDGGPYGGRVLMKLCVGVCETCGRAGFAGDIIKS